MKCDARQTEGVPLTKYDAKIAELLTNAAQSEGAITGNVIHFPSNTSMSNGIEVAVWQSTGAITDSGSIISKIQSSPDGITYTDLYTFPSQGASAFQSAIITVTTPYIKFIGTVSGGGAGTIVTGAGCIY